MTTEPTKTADIEEAVAETAADFDAEVKIKKTEIKAKGGETVEEPKVEKTKLAIHAILGQDKIKKQLDVAVELDMPVLVVGDTGTGKTTIIKELAEKYNRDYVRFNLTGETSVDEFVGKYVLEEKKTKWEDGVLLQAMKKGHWLIVDEVNVALPEILFVLHSLLDDDKHVMVANHDGEIVRPHENFRFFGTMNPVDEYAGTKDLNKAFKSRFGMILNMEYPDPKTEVEVVAGKGGVEKDAAAEMVDTAVKIRQAKENNEVFYTCSTRDLIQWASLSEKLGVVDAFEVAILNKANGDREFIARIYADITGKYIKAKASGMKLNIDYYADQEKKLAKKKREFAKQKVEMEEEVKRKLIEGLVGGKPVHAKTDEELEAEAQKILDEELTADF